MRKSPLRKVSGVYCLECAANGKKYIGQSRNLGRRLGEHLSDLRRGVHHNRVIQSDYDKYGEDSFHFHVIASGELSDEEMDQIEREEIERAGGVDSEFCYNVFSGGMTGYTSSKRFKESVSNRMRGVRKSDNFRRLASDNAKKQWQNKEYRDLMVASVKKQWSSDIFRQTILDAHLGKSESCGHILTNDKVREIRSRYNDGEKVSDLAFEFGVAESTMRSAINKTNWKNA